MEKIYIQCYGHRVVCSRRREKINDYRLDIKFSYQNKKNKNKNTKKQQQRDIIRRQNTPLKREARLGMRTQLLLICR